MGISNRLKQKLMNNEKLVGTHISMTDGTISELYGYVGFDFIWVDTEHTPIDYASLLSHLNGARLAGTPAIVRLSIHDSNHTKRVLEMGPEGVVFPMINTAEEADFAMKSCMYPPYGTRGFGPLRAVRYGTDDVADYIRNGSMELCRFIQIESETAVKNLPEIVKNPYIDGYIFGPNDLSGSIGELGNVFGDRTISLIKEAIAILRAHNKPIGVSSGTTDPDVLKFWYDLGIHMISAGVDYDYILKGAAANLKQVRTIFGEL